MIFPFYVFDLIVMSFGKGSFTQGDKEALWTYTDFEKKSR